MIERMDIFGTSTIGIFACPTDRYCIVPGGMKEAIVNRLEQVLAVPVIPVDLIFKKLAGVMLAGNSNGILLPNHIAPHDEEMLVNALESRVPGLTIRVLEESKANALGNLIAASDKAAVVSPKIPASSLPVIEQVLKVRVAHARPATSPLVGTKMVANASGCLFSPLVTDDEANTFKTIFNVEQADFTTVCLGLEAIRVGLIANSHGAIVGNATSGPEIARISEVLGV